MTEIAVGQTVLDRYVIEKRLGMGSFGTVWLAEDRENGAKIALKVLHPRFAGSPITRARFEREARVLLDMQHPGIAAALSFHQKGDLMCFALELVEGKTLEGVMGDRTRGAQPFTLEEVRRVMHLLCDAVGHAHALGVIHRDLKPANVMTTDDLRPKVLDFGLLKLVDAEKHEATTRGRQIGSMLYMSPEQILGEPTEAPGDVFALGSILFELLTQRRAWALEDDGTAVTAFDKPVRSTKTNSPTEVFRRITRGPRPKPSAYRAGLPAGTDALVARALAIVPGERFPTAAALKGAIEETLGPAPEPVPDTKISAPRRPRRWPWVVAGAALLALVPFWIPKAPQPEAPPPSVAPVAPAVVRAVPAPVETPAPTIEASVAPSPTRPPRRVAATPSPSATPAVPAAKPYARLWTLLRDAKIRADPATISQLGEAIAAAAAADVADVERRRKIQRMAQSSSLVGDMNGLEQALTLLSEGS